MDGLPEPLDLSSLMNGAPQPQAQKPGFDKSKLMRLIPLVAAAAKGGPGALEGLLHGYQQAEAQKTQQATQQQQTQRQGMLDATNLQGQQFNQQMQVHNAQQAQRQAQAALESQFEATLAAEGLDSPEALDLVVQRFEAQGRAVGATPGTFRDRASQAIPATTLQRRAAEKKVNALKAQFGVDKWMQEGAKFRHRLSGGREVSFNELLTMAGMTVDPAAPQGAAQSAIASDIPLDRQHAMALASGNEALAKTIEQSMTRQDKAKSQPADPQMAELNRQIAQLRLENLKGAKDTAALPPRIQRQVDAQAKGFDSQPVTKRTQVMAEAVSFANGMDPNTKNPADDQALIYSFAKAMDPDSVVREGEYATVQKYAQSWAERFGFTAARIFSNTAFLTPQARQQMKATIASRYQAARAQYDNVRSEYARRIGRMTGDDGAQYLIDYAGAFPDAAQGKTPAQTGQRIGRFEIVGVK